MKRLTRFLFNRFIFNVLYKTRGICLKGRDCGMCGFLSFRMWNFSPARETIVIFFNNFVGRNVVCVPAVY